jgi:hypothetical protein
MYTNRHTCQMRLHVFAVNRNTWEITMYQEPNQVGFPELMTETELTHFLRIPDVSGDANPHNVIENLKRFHQLPCIHISKEPLYPLTAVRRWVEGKLVKEQST